MVLAGRVRELDRIGNDAADAAADFGRRRVDPAVMIAVTCPENVGGGILLF